MFFSHKVIGKGKTGEAMYLSIVLFAVSMSIDAFGAGSTYGIQKIKISFFPKLLMSLLAFASSAGAMLLGGTLSAVLPEWFGNMASAAMLGILGGSSVFSALLHPRQAEPEPLEAYKKALRPRKRFHCFWKWLGISITIIRHPSAADFDHSRSIDKKEALYVGLALSFDAIGAGIGYSLSGTVSWLLPVLTAVFQFLMLGFGSLLGRKMREIPFLNQKILSLLPGIIMLVLAVSKLSG